MGVSVHLSEDLFGFWLDGSTFFVTNGSTAVGGECGRFCGGSASMGNAGFGTTMVAGGRDFNTTQSNPYASKLYSVQIGLVTDASYGDGCRVAEDCLEAITVVVY
ncbi:hypothetical protein Tco_0750051, partial [Tanacetum coccineum]